MQNDQLFDLLSALSSNKIDYVICGGIACVLQGVERATYDLDISVLMEQENLEKILKVMKQFKLVPRIPEPAESLLDPQKRKNWIEQKGALVFTFISKEGPLQIDIFLKYPVSFENLKEHADQINIENIKLNVSSKQDLVYAKKQIEPLREKDQLDINALEKLIEKEKQ